MRKHLLSVGTGVALTAVGLVLWLALGDIETPIIGLRQLGIVLAVLGVIEIVISGFALVLAPRQTQQ